LYCVVAEASSFRVWFWNFSRCIPTKTQQCIQRDFSGKFWG